MPRLGNINRGDGREGLRHLIFWQHTPQSMPIPPLQRSHHHGAAGKVSFPSSSPALTLPPLAPGRGFPAALVRVKATQGVLHTRATTTLFKLTFELKQLPNALSSTLKSLQTPESTELLPPIVWENTTQNGSKGGKMELAPNLQRGSEQPRDPDPLGSDSLLGKITGHFLLQLNSLFTENPTHPKSSSRILI